jgi:REP element-mobilizing transposase RayT
MPQSLASILVHLIFSTKNRDPTIPRPIRPNLHAYITGVLANHHCPSLQTGGTGDHVHVLLSLARTVTVADLVEEAKKSLVEVDEGAGRLAFSHGRRATVPSRSGSHRRRR